MNDSKRLVENWGIPQFIHCHETLLWQRASYTGVAICMQSTWYQPWQSSHATPRCFHVTALSHIWHGYLLNLWPGLSSTSAAFASKSRLRYSKVWVLDAFRMDSEFVRCIKDRLCWWNTWIEFMMFVSWKPTELLTGPTGCESCWCMWIIVMVEIMNDKKLLFSNILDKVLEAMMIRIEEKWSISSPWDFTIQSEPPTWSTSCSQSLIKVVCQDRF